MAYSDDWTYDFTAFTQAVEMPGPKPGFFFFMKRYLL